MTPFSVAAALSAADADDAAHLINISACGVAPCLSDAHAAQRSSGTIDLAFKAAGARTRLDRAYQAGCGKVRLPRDAAVPHPTGVIINTAGGLTGGDRFDVRATLAAGTRATLTTQAAERVYRSAGGAAVVENRLDLDAGSRLDWLPQETILFDHGALDRSTTVAMDADATLTACELMVFGRGAMGETVRHGALRDRWRIVRGGTLIFADATRLNGPIHDLLADRATAAGGSAMALVVHVAPNAESLVALVRARLEAATAVRAGVSGYDGLVVARMVATGGQQLRALVMDVMACLRDGLPPPRPWLL